MKSHPARVQMKLQSWKGNGDIRIKFGFSIHDWDDSTEDFRMLTYEASGTQYVVVARTMEAIQFSNDSQEQEKLCNDLLGALTNEETEEAALSSFGYASLMPKSNANPTEGQKIQQSQAALRMVRRHVIAQNNSRDGALHSLKATLEFRKTSRVNEIRSIKLNRKEEDDAFLQPIRKAILEDALPLPKMIVRGHDKEGRATLIKFQNSKFFRGNNPDLFIQVQLYWMERAIACSEAIGQEKINLVMDYTNYSRANKPPMSLMRRCITTLQTHYPERLQLMIACDPTLLLRTIWSVASWFMDPETREKIIFVSGEDAKTHRVSKHYQLDQAMPFLLPNGTLGTVTEEHTNKFLFDLPLDRDYDGH